MVQLMKFRGLVMESLGSENDNHLQTAAFNTQPSLAERDPRVARLLKSMQQITREEQATSPQQKLYPYALQQKLHVDNQQLFQHKHIARAEQPKLPGQQQQTQQRAQQHRETECTKQAQETVDQGAVTQESYSCS